MSAVKEKGRGTFGVVASIVLHVLFFGGCLILDTSNVTTGNEDNKEVTEINQVGNTTAMAVAKS